MRSRYKFEKIPGNIYFVTFTVIGHIPIFTNSLYNNILINNFKFYQEHENLKIFYYVIMDNHLHLIVRHDHDVSKVIKNYKSFTAKEMIKSLHKDKREWILYLLKYYKKQHKQNSTYQFWEEGSHPKLISDTKMLYQKIGYIHRNPVKRGLVAKPEDWYYSSAKNNAGLDNCFEIDELQ
ncbi:MAG: transposase [Candidatus Cloacimonadota bacterium]|nr:transposase [Candidatus Cloacimonadota bacterium]